MEFMVVLMIGHVLFSVNKPGPYSVPGSFPVAKQRWKFKKPVAVALPEELPGCPILPGWFFTSKLVERQSFADLGRVEVDWIHIPAVGR